MPTQFWGRGNGSNFQIVRFAIWACPIHIQQNGGGAWGWGISNEPLVFLPQTPSPGIMAGILKRLLQWLTLEC